MYKHSKQRQALLSLLQSVDHHPTAAWLYQHLRKDFPDISQGTVYRNLHVLIEQSLVRPVHYGQKSTRFDADVSMHHHVICRSCGKVEDVSLGHEALEYSRVSKKSGYYIESSAQSFFGLCPDCQKNAELQED